MNEKPEIEGYLFRDSKTGDFNMWRTLLELYIIIPESLVAYCAVVFAQIVNEQTNKHTWLAVGQGFLDAIGCPGCTLTGRSWLCIHTSQAQAMAEKFSAAAPA